jgi:hypothetical protein
MDVLQRYRAYLIAVGRRVAVRLCRKQGTADSREVTDFMERTGYLAGYTGKYCWVGAVFNASRTFEWTGNYRTHTNEKRNNHEQVLRVWKLRDNFEMPAAPGPKPPPLPKQKTDKEIIKDLEAKVARLQAAVKTWKQRATKLKRQRTKT